MFVDDVVNVPLHKADKEDAKRFPNGRRWKLSPELRGYLFALFRIIL